MIHVIKNIISKKECKKYLLLLKDLELPDKDGVLSHGFVEGKTRIIHNLPHFMILHKSLTSLAENVFKKNLAPTYSFFRMYYKNSELKSHYDHDQCEYSLSLNLGVSNKNINYPLKFTNGKVPLEVSTIPGEGIFYNGINKAHWRDKCPVDWYAQLFLHWVEPGGPYDYVLKQKGVIEKINDSTFKKFLSIQK